VALGRRVSEYADLGFHRTGTDVDVRTIDWFSAELAALGGRVDRRAFAFRRFDAVTTVTIDGEEVPSDALYYEGVGDFRSRSPRVASVVAATGDRTSEAFDEEIARARDAGADGLVVATQGAVGELVMPNRVPRPGSGLPVVLVPGRHGEGLLSGRVAVEYAARLGPGASANVVASFGAGAGRRPIVLATPLSGWYTCAAERATGIAVLLGLVERFAGAHPLLVVGASGHELLHHIGLQALLDVTDIDAELVVHLGANVAVCARDPSTGALELAPGGRDGTPLPPSFRGAFVRMPAGRFPPIGDALAPADLHPLVDPPQFRGEGALWARATDAPLMSFVGVSPLFHTPADVPDNTTTGEATATVLGAIGDAIAAFLTAGAA
jgi:hypothetical protein